MPRPLRIEYADALYHVTNRGQGRRTVFPGDEYYQAFLTTLAEAHQRFGVQIHAYCLTARHYHLLLQTPRANLSSCMRHINGLYTQRHNRLRSADGPLFRGRYKSVLVEAEAYLLPLTRYIHRNPIEAKPSSGAKLDSYRWSSYLAYINKSKPPNWLYREAAYGLLGHRQRYRAYCDYVESGIDEELSRFYGKAHRAPILGTEQFIAEVKARADKNVTRAKRDTRMGQLPTIKQIIVTVGRHFRIETKLIEHAPRGRGSKNVPRWVAMYLCREIGGHSLRDIGAAFHLGHISGVNQQMRRLMEEVEDDPALKKALNVLIRQLTP